MSMDNYNPDLIFDLVAGNLPADEARAAEAALSPEGRAELEAQRAVLAFIVDSPPATMTDIERAHLHRSVASAISETTRELSPVAVARPAPPRPTRRAGVFVRWASAAAAAAMLVGVVAVGSQLGGLGGSGDDTADTIASAEAAAATSTTAAGANSDAASDTAPGFSGDIAGGSGSDGAAAEDSDRFSVTDELLEAPALRDTDDKTDLEEVTAWLQDASRERSLLDPIEDITALPCYAVAAEDDDLDIADGFLVEYVDAGGTIVQGIAYADPGTDTVEPIIRVYDYLTCEPVVASTD